MNEYYRGYRESFYFLFKVGIKINFRRDQLVNKFLILSYHIFYMISTEPGCMMIVNFMDAN
jgi:hypothetical protein